MATEMDIEMDIDVGLDADVAIQDIELPQQQLDTATHPSLPSNTFDAESQQPVPNKIHISGLDNLTTKDINAFAAEYYKGEIERIEWIDDSSANLVYGDPDSAREALLAFSAEHIRDITQLPLLQNVLTKAVPTNSKVCLKARIAVVGDRKQAGARERSRFYLFNPEYDPSERRKQSNGRRNGRRYRDRDDGYRSTRYDDREQQKRQADDREAGFDACLYDDDEASLALRASRSHKRSNTASSDTQAGDVDRRLRFRGAAGKALFWKELFPSRRSGIESGRLRDRSASPSRDSEEESRPIMRPREHATSANRLKAQIIKSQLRAANPKKELFPSKTTKRRSSAFDAAADETADLFSYKMPAVPFMDGSSEKRSRDNNSLASRITNQVLKNRITSPRSEGFTIRGTADVPTTQSFSVKGAASGTVKELFPPRNGDNAGKELFSDRLEGRRVRRQKAEDLFF